MAVQEDDSYLPDVERARRLWVSLQMSVHAGSGHCSPGFRVVKEEANRIPELSKRCHVLESLRVVAKRLENVQIKCQDALDIVGRLDSSETLVYFDPPYVRETRTKNTRYAYEWSKEDHVEAAHYLRRAKGYVVISGYDNPLYQNEYEAYGWHRVYREATTNSGGRRTESLWLSPRTWQALNYRMSGLPLFSAQEHLNAERG